MSRAAKGEGRPYQRGQDKRWVVAVRDQAGRRRYLYASSPDGVVEKRDDYLGRIRMGLNPPTGKHSVGRVLDEWLADRRGKVRPATYVSYEGQIRLHLAPLRRIQLVRLQPADVRRLVANLAAAGLAPRSVAYALTILRMALRQAVDDGLVPRNVASAVKAPKVNRRELDVWTEGEAQAFLAATVDDELGALWAVLLAGGLRLGEALGLRWRDVDFGRGRVTVSGSLRPVAPLVRLEKAERLQRLEPKTDAGWRPVFLADFAMQRLVDQRDRADGRPASRLGLVFTTPRGTPLDPRNVSRVYEETLERTGTRRIRIHDIRHTCATILLGHGYTLEDLKRMLGHETIATTSDLYGHLVEARSRELAEGMQAAIGGRR